MTITTSDIITGGAAIISCLALYLASKKQITEERTASANEVSEALSFLSESKIEMIEYQSKLRKQEEKCKACNPEVHDRIKLFQEASDLIGKIHDDLYQSLSLTPKGTSIYDLILKKGQIKAQLNVLKAINGFADDICNDCSHNKPANQRAHSIANPPGDPVEAQARSE